MPAVATCRSARQRRSVDELEVVRPNGRGRAPCVVDQPRSDDLQTRRVKRIESGNRFVGDDCEQHLHRSNGVRVCRQGHAEGCGIAAGVGFRFQSVRQAIVIDEHKIEATPFEIGDRP